MTAFTVGGFAALTLDDHPITGPVFSGPQQLPFFCETTGVRARPGHAAAVSAPTMVSYQYKTTAGAFAPLADPTQRPADLATATVDGQSVPYIVRVEQRHDRPRRLPDRRAVRRHGPRRRSPPDTSWNGRLVYTFGGGCNAGYHQGARHRRRGQRPVPVAGLRGRVVERSTCSTTTAAPIISAEAAMMVKEHFIETYGPVAHTIGWGGSGGAIQQYDIAESYPGILDGIVPASRSPTRSRPPGR